MRSYTFYLYKDDGGLIGSTTRDAESDAAARGFSLSLFESYPGCEELEIWETPRYVAQRRRRASDSVASSRRRSAAKSGPAVRQQPGR
jgi:hypothetical protein